MKLDQIVCGDSVKWMRKRLIKSNLEKTEPNFADLIFADPPFNIGYEYDTYQDNLPKETYLAWCREWIDLCAKMLNANGSMFLAIGDEFAAEMKIMLDGAGLHMRNWIIWHYTFGVACKNKFSRSHAHIFYYTKDKEKFTFNSDAVRIRSARQEVYRDKRAERGGKNPDDLWVLRPQSNNRFFQSSEDTWFFSRICGTFKERGEHPCQMPLALMERIVLSASNKGDVVFDPFAGSGATCVAAKRHNRHYIGIEMSKTYQQAIIRRLTGERKTLT